MQSGASDVLPVICSSSSALECASPVPRSAAGTAARVACWSAFGVVGALVSAKLIADSSAVTASTTSAVGAGAASYPATWAARSSAVKMLSASRFSYGK